MFDNFWKLHSALQHVRNCTCVTHDALGFHQNLSNKGKKEIRKERESKLEYRPEIFRPELYCDRRRKIHNGSHPQNRQE